MDAGNTKDSAKRVRGKPFLPGQSGNPSGRPAMPEEVKRLLETAAPEAIQFQIDTMRNEEAPYQMRVKCSELLADRGLGKPIQGVRNEGEGPLIVVFKDNLEGV